MLNPSNPPIALIIEGLMIVAGCLTIFKVVRFFYRRKDSKKELIRQARMQRENIGRRVKK